jgi:hypothetical protein
MHTNPPPAEEPGKHRSTIQTTGNGIGGLVERFEALNFKEWNQFFHEIVANILPTRRSQRHGVLEWRRLAHHSMMGEAPLCCQLYFTDCLLNISADHQICCKNHLFCCAAQRQLIYLSAHIWGYITLF